MTILPHFNNHLGDDFMFSLSPNYLDSLRFSDSQLSTLKKIGEYRGKQELYIRQTPETLASLRQLSIVESSESSNRIEGIVAPHHRVEAIVLKEATPKNRSEQEIAGYRDALALIHESAKHMTLSTNLILQLHNMLYRYSSGKGGHWKITDNQIIEKNPDGSIHRVRFTPTTSVMTPQAMDDLIKLYNRAINERQYEPLIAVPLAIFDFLCIHPFTDGNGRTARLLTLLLLYHFDYEVGRYISLERIFEESKETYYEVLETSSLSWHEQKHDVFPWLNYFWGTLIRAYQEFEERVGNIRRGKGYKTVQIISAIENKIGTFSISDIEKACPGTSRDMVRMVLRQLRDQGKIKAIGQGRGAKWFK